MNKLLKVLLCGFLAAAFQQVNAQDNPTSLRTISDEEPVTAKKKLAWRIYGGPSLDFMVNGDYSTMKGGRFGMNGGLEVNKAFGKKRRAYATLGLGVASSGIERWINGDPTVKSKSAFDQFSAIDIPVGIGFNFGKQAPRGAYLNLGLINSITLKSETNYLIVPVGSFEATANVVDNTLDRYNLGARIELGYKAKFDGNSYASFSLAPRMMFYNRFSTNTNQYTGLNLVALMSFYF
jgi:hypothetical protein